MSNTIQTQIYSVGQTFGIPGAENIQMTSHAPCGNPYVPQTNANYKFRKDLLRNILMYLQAPCGDALYLSGPTGSGKRAILAAEVPQIPEDLRDKMIKIANEIRKKFLSEDRELNVTLSTRKLVQWGKLWTQCYGAPSPAQMSLDIALLNRCQTGEREAINRLCELEFGSAVWTPRL